jgi:Na+/proline symporter
MEDAIRWMVNLLLLMIVTGLVAVTITAAVCGVVATIAFTRQVIRDIRAPKAQQGEVGG